MPLIYLMSWRSCRRFGQAFSETASWVVGYLFATAILLLLHFGGVGMISATPDDPLQIVAVVGGFIGMGISRYLWKRRGGHLEPVKHPLTDNRWFRGVSAAVKATVSSGKSAQAKRAQQRPPATRSASTAPSAATSNTTARAATSNTAPPGAAASSKTAPSTAVSNKTAPRSSTAVGKSSAQKWGRVVGAMLTPPESRRRPPQ